MNQHLAALLILAGGSSFGLLASFVSLGLSKGYSVPEITGSQQLFGAIIVWLLAFLKRHQWQKLKIRTILSLMAVGSLSGLTGFLYYSSMSRVPVSIAIVLLFQFTWIGSLFEWIFDKRKPRLSTYLLLATLLIGTTLAANINGSLEQQSLAGFGFGFLAAFTFAAYLYASGKVATDVSPWLRTPVMVTGACILILVLFPPVYLTPENLMTGLGSLGIITALLGAVIPPICFVAGAPHLRAGMVTILSSIELPIAVLTAWIVLNEAILPHQWLGISLILLAIILTQKNKNPVKTGSIK